jgi:hypothetical protein
MHKKQGLQKLKQNIQQLKTNITTLIQEIEINTLQKVFRNLMKRAQIFINDNGGLFEHLM